MVNGKCNPAGKNGADCDVEAKLALGGFGSDTVKSWTHVEACTDLKTLHKAHICENISIKNDDLTFNVGGKGTWCNSHKKMEEIHG